MAYPYDEDFEEDSGIFHDERPTQAETRRAKRRELAKDPDYKLGKIIAETIRMRRDVDYLLQHDRVATGRSGSLFHRPPVQTAGISITASLIVAILYQIAQKMGVFQ